jgi:hypothetical protein
MDYGSLHCYVGSWIKFKIRSQFSKPPKSGLAARAPFQSFHVMDKDMFFQPDEIYEKCRVWHQFNMLIGRFLNETHLLHVAPGALLIRNYARM